MYFISIGSQYVATGQVEPDLAGTALAVLTDVSTDARKESPRDAVYVRVFREVPA